MLAVLPVPYVSTPQFRRPWFFSNTGTLRAPCRSVEHAEPGWPPSQVDTAAVCGDKITHSAMGCVSEIRHASGTEQLLND